MSQPVPAVFVDRDGTLIRNVDYLNDPAGIEVFPEAPPALARLKAAGFRVILITNQSGFARGLITQEQYDAVHARMLELIGPGLIDAAYMCPDFGTRRKPSPAMIEEAVRDWNIDPARSVMIGDKTSDIQCGQNAGVRTIFIPAGYDLDGDCHPTLVTANMAEAAEWIVRNC